MSNNFGAWNPSNNQSVLPSERATPQSDGYINIRLPNSAGTMVQVGTIYIDTNTGSANQRAASSAMLNALTNGMKHDLTEEQLSEVLSRIANAFVFDFQLGNKHKQLDENQPTFSF